MVGVLQSRALSSVRKNVSLYFNSFNNENKKTYFLGVLQSIQVLLDTFKLDKLNDQTIMLLLNKIKKIYKKNVFEKEDELEIETLLNKIDDEIQGINL
jgi:hypothetical protein